MSVAVRRTKEKKSQRGYSWTRQWQNQFPLGLDIVTDANTPGATAQQGSDFNAQRIDFEVTAEVAEKETLLETLDDGVDEQDEKMGVRVEVRGTAYKFEYGNERATCTILDDEGTPEAPRNVRPSAGDGEATVQWISNGDHVGPLVRHEYRLSQHDEWLAIPDSGDGEANDGEYTIPNLENGEPTNVYLRAVTEDGPGKSSNAITVVPQSGAAGPAGQLPGREGLGPRHPAVVDEAPGRARHHHPGL